MPDGLPLTRTASLTDFDPCLSVAAWQQAHARDAFRRWGWDGIGQTLCLNWGAAWFEAPGGLPIYLDYQADLPATPVAAVFALSVLDRIEQPLRFLRKIDRLLLPGGLLVCTVAAWDVCGPDLALGHEVRRRIYNRDALAKLIYDCSHQVGLKTFGGVDLRYHGDTLGDHTLAAVTVMKGDRR